MCCGQLGEQRGKMVSSRMPCDSRVKEAVQRAGFVPHAGVLKLSSIRSCESSRTSARKHGGDLALWSCCARVALPAWEAAWDSRDFRVPAELFLASGGCCLDAAYGAGAKGPSVSSRDLSAYESARVARPQLPPPPPPPPLPRENWEGVLKATVLTELPSTAGATAPLPSVRLQRHVEELFGLSPSQAAPAIWHRGVGGDGRCERLAARGDRILEYCITQRETGSEAAMARSVERYCCNAALASVAHKLTVVDELMDRGSWRLAGTQPSDHTLGTVVEALVAACHDVHGVARVNEAVTALVAMIDTATAADAVLSGKNLGESAAARLARKTVMLRISPAVFVVRSGVDGLCADVYVFEPDPRRMLTGPARETLREAVEASAGRLLGEN